MNADRTKTLLVLGASLGLLIGCDESVFFGESASNAVPTIRLTGGPLEGDTVFYRLEFSWMGYDADGRVDYYEFVVCDGNPTGFDPADTTGAGAWKRIDRTDSVFAFSCAEGPGGGNASSLSRRSHTFFVRAVDDRGGRSEPAYRSFTAATYSPYVRIVAPVNRSSNPRAEQQLPYTFRIAWIGVDPIDSPSNTQAPDSVRYFVAPATAETVNDMNRNPAAFESLWSPWFAYDAPGDSGTATVVGDDEILEKKKSYVFAVQAKDEAGAVTAVYDAATNVKRFVVVDQPGPLLTVAEQNLGRHRFLGPNTRTQTFRLPAGFAVNFAWTADASFYGCEVAGYRYGWDISDLGDPDEWDVLSSPYIRSAPPAIFNSGIHTIYIEAVDNLGYTTIASFEITIFPMSMGRNLLWVDDFFSTEFAQTNYAFPTESEHDAFWRAICGRARDFEPNWDIYDVTAHGGRPPDIELLWQYKNVIWSFSSSDETNAWDDIVRFTPDSWTAGLGPGALNYLALFMQSGGHIWTEGKSDRSGGLAAVLYSWREQIFPRSFRCEIASLSNGCQGDTSGVHSMGYRDYCVTIVDKVSPTPARSDSRMPDRLVSRDAMASGFKEMREPFAVAHSALPRKLELWSRVTQPGMFFDPQVRGFTYVEIYNPGYWMHISGSRRQACFVPMYRMSSRSSLSPINGAIVAFWTLKYAGVKPLASGTVAAPSVHFGLPLWFFDRAQADSIADVVFKDWDISVIP